MRSATPHALYRERLAALADDVVVGEALAGTWRRIGGRFHPQRPHYATVVLEAHDKPEVVRIEAFDAPPVRDARATVVRSPAVGWLRLARLPFDPALPTLPLVLTGDAAARVVRYHPFRRCTVQVRRADGGAWFGKVLADGRGSAIQAAGVELWRACARGELGFAVAPPRGFDRHTRTVWQAAVAGAPMMPRLLQPGGDELASLAGEALASLASASVATRRVDGARAQLVRSRSLAGQLARVVPSAAPLLAQLGGALERAARSSQGRPLRPIHGASRPGQWLVERTRLALVDFDGLARGDPERDTAEFLVALETEDPPRGAELGTAFLRGYEHRGVPLDAGLLRAYRAHALLAKAERAAGSLRPDGDARALRRLEQALRTLEAAE